MADYRVVQRPQIMIMGIECRTSNAPDAGPHDIPRLWEKFYKENIIAQISNKASDEILALYCDYEDDYTKPYSVVIGCPISVLTVVPQGMVVKIIPAGTYAHFHAIGEHPKSLIETWMKIWKTNLKRLYSSDYEVYGKKFTEGSPKEIDIYVGIQ